METKQIYEKVEQKEIVTNIAQRYFDKQQKTFLKNLDKSVERIKDRWANDLTIDIKNDRGDITESKTFNTKDKFAFLDLDKETTLKSFGAECEILIKDKLHKRLVRNAKAFY